VTIAADRPLRVVQWATGKLGSEILREAILRPGFDVVGCFVYSDAKAGLDAGEIVGLPPIGVKATTDRAQIDALDADLVLHCAQLQPTMDEHDADIARILASGKNVISIMGYSNPPALGAAHADPLLRACEKGQASLFGTGINPGFVCERLATTLTGLCVHVDHLNVLEAYDCTCSPALVLQVMGFGQDPDSYEAMALQAMWDGMYLGILHETVERLGGAIDRIDRSHDVSLSETDQIDGTIPIPVRAGMVAGATWQWTAIVEGKPFFTMQMQWYVGTPIPGWEQRSGWTITIDGSPSVQATVRNASTLANLLGGAPAEYNAPLMAALVLNAAPEVVAAAPGFFRAPVFATYRG
jgi:hypothetical protein